MVKSKKWASHKEGKGKTPATGDDDGIPVARPLNATTALERGFTVVERKEMKTGWGGPAMEPDMWWQIEGKMMRVEADGAELLRRGRGVVPWENPQEAPLSSAIDPKIAAETSLYANPVKLAALNEFYFAPGKPMRILGHVASQMKGSSGRGGSEKYAFAHEGGFLFNEHVLQNVGIRFPLSNFEIEVLNYIN